MISEQLTEKTSITPSLIQTFDRDIEEEITEYWNRRAEGFGKTRLAELSGPVKSRWMHEIASAVLGTLHPLRILDRNRFLPDHHGAARPSGNRD